MVKQGIQNAVFFSLPISTLLLHIHLFTPLTICHWDEPDGAVPHGTGPKPTEPEKRCGGVVWDSAQCFTVKPDFYTLKIFLSLLYYSCN